MGRSTVPSRIFVLISLVGALISVGAHADAAGRIACGSMVMRSITLHRDLLHCPGDGLVIGADNIVVNLGGHKITGNNVLVDHKGLRLEGHTGVVVKNGFVRNFYEDVFLHNETESVVKTIHAAVSAYLIYLCDSSYNTIARNVVGQTPNAGIMIDCTTNTNNDIRHNALHSDGVGIQLQGAASNTIEYNTISKATTGIFANVQSDADLIQHNTILRSLSSGILVTGNDSDLFANIVDHASIGIELRSNASTTSLIDNRTNLNTNQGILVGASTTQSTLDGNIAKRNGADGLEIDADEAATSVANSIADYNNGWGIDAATNVDDAGGNEAHGNTTAGQCTPNVLCRIG